MNEENNITNDISDNSTKDSVCGDNASTANRKTESDDRDTECESEPECEYDYDYDYDENKKSPKKLSKALVFISVLSVGLAAASGIIRLCFSKNVLAAEAFYRSVTKYLQAFMTKLTSILPFSLAETLVVLLPFAIIGVLSFAAYRLVKKDTYRLKRMVVCIFTVLCLLFSNFMLNLSILYCRLPLSELTGLDDTDVSADELCASSIYTIYKLQQCIDSDTFAFDSNGASVNPYGYDELDERIEQAYNSFAQKNSWLSPYGAKTKIISLSDLMTYTHISGIYTQYTGEANINVNYPDHVVCAAMAHEKAHQRGIAPEDEANLVAFFVLAESGDPYLEYCGYMSIFSDLTSDCRNADPEYYSRVILPLIPAQVRGDLNAYTEFFKKYEKSKASDLTDNANDAYLRFNGEEHGVASYRMTSGMAARYIMERIALEFYVE